MQVSLVPALVAAAVERVVLVVGLAVAVVARAVLVVPVAVVVVRLVAPPPLSLTKTMIFTRFESISKVLPKISIPRV